MEHLSPYRGSVSETWKGGGVLYWGLRDTRKAFEGEHLSLCRGFVRGTWREGPHIEDSERYVLEGSENGIIRFTGAPKGRPKGV